MRERRYWLRALGTGLVTTLTALAAYDRPPEWAAYWTPVLQGFIVALTTLGVNVATRRERERSD